MAPQRPGGWLALASALNILTVLTAEGLLDGRGHPAAFIGLSVVFVIAVYVLRTPRLALYGLPIAWGLVAIWVAEVEAKNGVAAMAMGYAVFVGGVALWQTRPSHVR